MKQEINLFAPKYRAPVGPFSARQMAVMLALFVAVGTGLYGYAHLQVLALQHEVGGLEAQRGDALARLDSLKASVPQRQRSALLERPALVLEPHEPRLPVGVASLSARACIERAKGLCT